MKDLYKRLEILAYYFGFKSLTDWEKEIDIYNLKKIGQLYPCVNSEWLQTGKGWMFNTPLGGLIEGFNAAANFMLKAQTENGGKKEVQNVNTNIKRVLTIDDVVELTGYTKEYIYKLVWLKEIPHYKPNKKRLYFERGEIENWMLQGNVEVKH